MDDNNAKMRANMEKVFRAMDVIPSLGSAGQQSDPAGATPLGRPHSDTSAKQAPIHSGIPRFDLGEKILAEQRRLTAQRRKAPVLSEPAESPPVEAGPVPVKPSIVVPVGDELLELQRIVAGIVARDIQCLCTGPVTVTSR